MDSPPLDNQTDFVVHPQILLTPLGERLTVFIKASFQLDFTTNELKLCQEPDARPIRHADEPWDAPTVDSIRYPADVGPEKEATDVILVGTACAPGGHPVPSFDAYLRVGPVARAIRIFGLRVWESGGAGVSSPRPLARLDVRYDFAWGGRAESEDGRLVEDSRNPVGRGVCVDSSALTHQLAPQIEDPDHLIRNYRTRPPPAGLGVRGRTFSPRREAAGTHDQAWMEFYCPIPPKDQGAAFRQCASEGLIARPPLRGGEACALLNLHPMGALQFDLPRVSLEVLFEVQGRERERVVPVLNTVLIDTSVPEAPPFVELTWVAGVRAPRKVLTSQTTVMEKRLS